MNEKQKFLIEFYLDYVNNFLTLSKMSNYYDISYECVEWMVYEGNRLHNYSLDIQ